MRKKKNLIGRRKKKFFLKHIEQRAENRRNRRNRKTHPRPARPGRRRGPNAMTEQTVANANPHLYAAEVARPDDRLPF